MGDFQINKEISKLVHTSAVIAYVSPHLEGDGCVSTNCDVVKTIWVVDLPAHVGTIGGDVVQTLIKAANSKLVQIDL